MFLKESYFSFLKTTHIGKDFSYFDTLTSTNDYIWKMNCAKPNHGQCVLAEEQTKGRGRRGNAWSSIPEKSLTFSLCIKTHFQPKQFGLISIVTGISIIKTIQQCLNVQAKLKWPNDVLIQDKKVGGILTESRRIDGKYIIGIGVGLNVNEKEISQAIIKTATSLKLIAHNHINREELLATILNNLEKDLLLSPDDICHEWIAFCAHQNDDISFHVGDKIIHGKFKGITKNGYAIVEQNGVSKSYPTGVIEL